MIKNPVKLEKMFADFFANASRTMILNNGTAVKNEPINVKKFSGDTCTDKILNGSKQNQGFDSALVMFATIAIFFIKFF